MTSLEKPARPWNIYDLMDLGKKSDTPHMRAVPVLILEQWVRRGRQEGKANYVLTNTVADRLESSGLVSGFTSRGKSSVIGGLSLMQSARNLTDPPLLEYQRERGRVFWINLPYYETLLQDYRRKYLKEYSEDYKKLFPEGEPEWEPPREELAKREKSKPTPSVPQDQDEISNLLAPLERALRDRQQAIEKLAEENQELRREIEMQVEVSDLAFAELDDLERREPFRAAIADDELRKDCAELLNQGYYRQAIVSAGVVLEERIRLTIGGNGPEEFKHGLDLVDYALKKDTGQLIIRKHPAEQEGVHLVFRGAMQVVRNPPAHKKVKYTEQEARQAISLIDYLLSLLGQAKLRQT